MPPGHDRLIRGRRGGPAPRPLRRARPTGRAGRNRLTVVLLGAPMVVVAALVIVAMTVRAGGQVTPMIRPSGIPASVATPTADLMGLARYRKPRPKDSHSSTSTVYRFRSRAWGRRCRPRVLRPTLHGRVSDCLGRPLHTWSHPEQGRPEVLASFSDAWDPTHRKNSHTHTIVQAQRSGSALPTSAPANYVRPSETGRD